MTDQTHFDETYYEGNQQDGDRLALWFYSRLAGREAAPGSKVLDYGSGVGYLSRRLSNRYSSIAYDPSEYARTRTAALSPRTRVVASTDDIEDATLDLICTLHVLEHVPAPITALSEFSRMLKPGGKLLYVVPNPQGWGHRIKRSAWFAYRDPTHCSLLSHAEWIALTEQAGFTVRKVAADGLWDPPYVRRVPRPVQLALLGLPGAVQVALGRMFLPSDWGECLIVVAAREP